MAIRTNEAAVKLLIEVDDTLAPTLDPFIETASALVDACCTAFDPAYTSTHLELIERWLSAHFYAILDPRKDSEKAGSVAEKNQYKVDLNLSVTTYGQQAMILDFKGGLSSINKGVLDGTLGAKIKSCWLGTEAT